jgi:dipeptidyl aminopeptidase/acylaminoacyl peptidase
LEGQSIWNPIYSPTGHILYRRAPANPGLWAVPFSLSRLEMTGEPFLVEPDGNFASVSSEGTLVFVRGASAARRELVWVNRKGEVEGGVGQPQQNIRRPALSPDERRAAVMGTENENGDIWIHDLQRGTRTRLTFSAGIDWDPAWSPTGDQIVFWGGDDSSLLMKAADGTGQIETLVRSEDRPDGEPDISRDGKFLVYTAAGEKTNLDLWYLPLAPEKSGAPGAGPAKPVVFLQTPASERHPAFSPDGHYLAYVSDESGRDEVYVKQFPGGEGKWQVSVNGGHWPRWSTRGDRLFYAEQNFMLEVPVQNRPSLSLGNPRRLFSGQSTGILVAGGLFGYAVSRDGQRFLMVRNAGEEDTKVSLTVVQNWFAEFKEKN